MQVSADQVGAVIIELDGAAAPGEETSPAVSGTGNVKVKIPACVAAVGLTGALHP